MEDESKAEREDQSGRAVKMNVKMSASVCPCLGLGVVAGPNVATFVLGKCV